MDFAQIAVILAALGIVFITAEVFLPSGGMITLAAILAFAVSAWFAWKAWWPSQPVLLWTYVAAVVMLVPAAIFAAFYFLPKTSVGRRILLEAPASNDVTPYQEEELRLSKLVGQVGKTLTPLTPGGIMVVNGERLHCFSEGMIIDQGESVVVVAARGNRVLVRAAPDEPKLAGQDPQDGTVSEGEERPLDFDLPQG